MTARRGLGAALCFAVLLIAGAGCGGGGIGAGVSKDAQGQLDLQVAAIRQSAAAGDMAHANSYLAELTASVQSLRSQGKLDDAAGTRILAAADVVRRELAGTTPTTAPTTTATTAPPPPDTAPPADHKRKGKGD